MARNDRVVKLQLVLNNVMSNLRKILHRGVLQKRIRSLSMSRQINRSYLLIFTEFFHLQTPYACTITRAVNENNRMHHHTILFYYVFCPMLLYYQKCGKRATAFRHVGELPPARRR